MRRPDRSADRLTAGEAGELAALDRLLAGAPVGDLEPEHAGLAALVVAVRDDRPPQRPDFARALDRRLAEGFPRRPARGPGAGPGRGRGRGRRGLRRPETRHLLAGLGAVATLAVVGVVAAGGPGRAAPTAGTALRAPAGPPAIGSVSAGAAQSPVPAPSTTPGLAPYAAPAPGSLGSRTVERDASLALLAPRGEVQRVSDRAIAATDQLGGIVESSNVSVDDQGGSQASLALEVPTPALDRALAALSALAHVSSRSQNALDITDATGAAHDRLTEAEGERDALLRQLAGATTANQVASLHARLGLVAGRIGQDRAQVQSLAQQARFAQVSLTIAEGQPAAGGASWGPAAALDTALGVLEAVFAVVVIGLAVVVPSVVLAGLGWWAARPLRRRRREGALAG